MSKIIAVSYAPVDGFPAGSAVDHIAITVTDPSAVATVINVAPDTASAPFDATIVGNYNVTAQAVAADGSVFGTPVSATFVVVAPVTVTLSLPSAVSVTDAP
jgi:hypothetical protein